MLIEKVLQEAHVNYIVYSKPLQLFIFSSDYRPTRVFWQDGPILWVHFQASPSKVAVAYHQALVSLLFKAVKASVLTFG